MANKLEELTKVHFKELYENNFYINDWEEDEEQEVLTIDVRETNHPGKCPCCGQESTKIHGRNPRKVQDIPFGEKTTYLNLHVNKYVCMNPDCEQRTFVEEQDFFGPCRPRTYRLEAYILSIARMMSNEGASQVLRANHVIVSNDSINRLYQRLEFKEITDPTEIGIDDVAIFKGHKYATVIYDEKTHELLALLPGRSVEETKKWLMEHPKIKRVARDRQSNYAQAIKEALPECEQVADRFHLLQNMSDKIEEVFKEELPEAFYFKEKQLLEEEPDKEKDEVVLPSLKRRQYLDQVNYDNEAPLDENGQEVVYDNKLRERNGLLDKKNEKSRKKKQNLILEVQDYWNGLEKKKYKLVAEKFDLSHSTVKKYVHMTEEEIKALDQPRKYKRKTHKPIHDWLNVIYKMLRDGYRSDEIYYYVRSRSDVSLTNTSIRNAIERINKNNFNDRKSRISRKSSYAPDIVVVHRRDLMRYIISRESNIPDFEDYFESIMETYPVVRLYDEIYRLFYETIMGDEVEKLQEFLESVAWIDEMKGFCRAIKKDIEAVRNSISSKTSSGFVEGLNCKFKLIKRILYGRALLVNLEKKCFLCFMEDYSNEKLLKIVKNTFSSKKIWS